MATLSTTKADELLIPAGATGLIVRFGSRVYDTETTGLVKGVDYTNPNMPFLASIAAILYDNEAHRIVASVNSMIQPDGWTMPKEAGQVNGLTDASSTSTRSARVRITSGVHCLNV